HGPADGCTRACVSRMSVARRVSAAPPPQRRIAGPASLRPRRGFPFFDRDLFVTAVAPGRCAGAIAHAHGLAPLGFDLTNDGADLFGALLVRAVAIGQLRTQAALAVGLFSCRLLNHDGACSEFALHTPTPVIRRGARDLPFQFSEVAATTPSALPRPPVFNSIEIYNGAERSGSGLHAAGLRAIGTTLGGGLVAGFGA